MNQVSGCYKLGVEASPALERIASKGINHFTRPTCSGEDVTIPAAIYGQSLECPAGYRLGFLLPHVVALGI